MEGHGSGLKHEKLTGAILRAFYDVYNELGRGFLESVYENSMALALSSSGIRVDRQYPIPVWFRGYQVGDFKADLLVGSQVIVELKAARSIELAHEAQLINYLRATEIEVGLLLNFGPEPQFKRFAYDNSRKTLPKPPV